MIKSDGYFSIGIYNVKSEVNVGTLWRSAFLLGASYIFTIGARYKAQSSDTVNVPIRIPLFEYETFEEYKKALPKGCRVVAIEQGGKPLKGFGHPKICSYLLGAEDNGIPKEVLKRCYTTVRLDSLYPDSYNVATAGAIVLYHREYLRY